MKSKIIFLGLFLFASTFFLPAQEIKLRVAIFDPTSSGATIDEGTKVAVREIISSVFVNSGKFTIVERSLIERVMQEQKFSTSGAVDDTQASEIGRLAGANKIVLSVVARTGNSMMLSIKFVDVNSASVEKQKTQVSGANQLLDFVEPMTMELIREVEIERTIINELAKQQEISEQKQIVEQEEIIEKQQIDEQQEISDQRDVSELDNEIRIDSIIPQNDITTVIPNIYDPVETKPETLSIQKGATSKSTTYYTIGGISIAAGIAATLFLTKEYEEYGYAKKIVGKEYNLIYAGAGLAIGGFCIIKGIQLKKKAKAKTPTTSYRENHSHIDLVATGTGAGLRLTF